MNEQEYFWPEEDACKGAYLDNLLAMGFYRMQHMLFTTNFTSLDALEKPVSVFWLRTNLKTLKDSRNANMVRKKCAAFSVRYKNAVITEEIESLYQCYREHVHFKTSESCKDYLHFCFTENPFDSKIVEIRLHEKLIAVGFFDCGKNSIAGILNIYHPDFKQYCLGKFLMLKKIDYALQHQIGWYYTGYISPDCNKFDYKIFPDEASIEVYLPIEKKWEPYLEWGKERLSDYFNLRAER